jgi:gliding motility-associated-like protein
VRFSIIAFNILLIAQAVSGQLSSSSASAVRYATYPSLPGIKDPVFIYCNSSGNVKGEVLAESSGGTAPFSFNWMKWSDATKSFSIPVKNDLNVANSVASGLGEGGYRVTVTNGGGYNEVLTCWVHLDKPYAEAKLQNFTCDYVALSGKAVADTFHFRDPVTGNLIKLRNAVRFLWSSTPASAIPFPDIEINPVTFTPPLEDVTYKLEVTDSFLCASSSEFPYTSIHVKADFTADPAEGEAPLVVSFTDKSVRGSTYLWEFGDDSTSDLQVPLPHTYYRPGEYKVKLTVESDLHCIDSMVFEKIVVDPSDLGIPNVFTPDGDGINDYFVTQDKSLRSLSVEIFSRSGILVYSFRGEGQKLSEWQGWDGSVNESSRKATPGVYYYIIRARGWDDKLYDGKEYRGFLYLYR